MTKRGTNFSHFKRYFANCSWWLKHTLMVRARRTLIFERCECVVCVYFVASSYDWQKWPHWMVIVNVWYRTMSSKQTSHCPDHDALYTECEWTATWVSSSLLGLLARLHIVYAAVLFCSPASVVVCNTLRRACRRLHPRRPSDDVMPPPV